MSDIRPGSFLGRLFWGDRLNVAKRFDLLGDGITRRMSTFYKAREKETGEVVGLKLVDPKKTAEFEAKLAGLNKPSEGEIAMKFDHPYIARTLEHGITTDNHPYIISEYLDGVVLDSLIWSRDSHLSGRRRKFIYQAAEALAAVHANGFLHRDFCPENLMLSADGETVKLIDFGCAIPATRPFQRPKQTAGRRGYQAPEAIGRKCIDRRIDVFSFGVTAYRLCSLAFPWSDVSMSTALLNKQPPRDIREHCPIHPKLRKAIHYCLEPAVENRCPSIEEFMAMIRDLLPKRRRERRSRPAVARG